MISFCPARGAIVDNFIQIAKDLSLTHSVSVLCPSNLELKGTSFSDIFTLPYSKKNPLALLGISSIRNIFRLYKKTFDIVFCFDQHIFNVFFSSFFKDSHIVMWWHEPVLTNRHAFLNRLMYSCHDYFMTKRSEKIIIACNSLREVIPSNLQHKIEVIPLPFLEYFHVNNVQTDIIEDVDLLFFGNITKYKGLNLLAESLEKLYDRNILISLYVLGSGNINLHAPKLLELASRYPSYVHIKNTYHSYATIAKHISSSRAVVLPYLSATGTNTLPIAYRYSKPVIASRTGSLSDYLIDGVTGKLFEPGDADGLTEAIRLVCLHSDVSLEMGKNAYAYYFENFRQTSVTQKLVSLFSCMKV